MERLTFSLEAYNGPKSRHNCPFCFGKKTFTRYINSEGSYLGEHVGKCDRLSNCQAHYTPKQFFEEHGLKPELVKVSKPDRTISTPSFIDKTIVNQTLNRNNENRFALWLINAIGRNDAMKQLDRYQIGSATDGKVIYWQIDEKGLVHTGKVMQYQDNGHRDKTFHPQWAHNLLKLPAFELQQCFFGLHLINESNNPIGIVEAEKTAIICAHFMPETIWISCGGLMNLTKYKFKPLAGRKIMLYPDAGCYDTWMKKAKDLGITNLQVSDWLERNTTTEEKKAGMDLADILIENLDTMSAALL